jgi:hypothetical protein
MNMIAECFVDVLQDKGLLRQYVLEVIVKELDCVNDLFRRHSYLCC